MKKTAYSYDDKGNFDGLVELQLDKLESKIKGKKIYLLPRNATHVQPPTIPDGKIAKWNGQVWRLEELPKPVEIKEDEPVIEPAE